MTKRGINKKELNKDLTYIRDGFNGILALVIYNFLLYLSKITNIGGFIAKTEQAAGNFGLNSFVDFEFTKTQMTTGVIIVFALTFLLGIFIGNLVRKYKLGTD